MATQNLTSTNNDPNNAPMSAPNTSSSASSNPTVSNTPYPLSQNWAIPAASSEANLLLEDYETQEEFERAILLDRMRKNARQTIAHAPSSAECEGVSKKWAHWFAEAYEPGNTRMVDEAMRLRLQWMSGIRMCNKGKGCDCAGVQEELRREEGISKEERARRRLNRHQVRRN